MQVCFDDAPRDASLVLARKLVEDAMRVDVAAFIAEHGGGDGSRSGGGDASDSVQGKTISHTHAHLPVQFIDIDI
jgi:hypothetical protein